MYPGGVDEFITKHLTELFEGIYKQFPPPAARAKLAQIKALEAEVRTMARPSVSTTAVPGTAPVTE